MADVLDQIDQTTDSDLDVGTQDDVADSSQADSGTEHQETQQQTEADKVDGRRFNPEWSKALKELRELYPDRADMLTKLRDNYARYQALQEVAPKGLDDVRQWKTTLDALGGSEAAAELMQRDADMREIDSRIEAGDYGVIGELTPEWQKGFYQMLPDALTDLSEKDPAAFSAAVAPHFQAALLGTGMGDHLKKMYAAAGDNEPLKELIKQQYDWFQSQTQGKGEMSGGKKTVSPEVQRLQTELDSRRKADDEAFTGRITDDTNKYVEETFEKHAAVYLKQFNLTDAQKSDLSDSFAAKLVDKLGADSAFQKQLGAYKSLKNRSPETVNNYIRAKIDENAKPILDGLVTARYGGMRKAKPAVDAGTKTTDNGAVRVAQAPDQSQWDMGKMEAAGYEATVKRGIFYLQGNRTVQLARPN
jgi:hypothetical protein